tara:strand:- start:144 stop:296 length:153 start_codon:yes stop_codon:yes gene_type:complete
MLDVLVIYDQTYFYLSFNKNEIDKHKVGTDEPNFLTDLAEYDLYIFTGTY